MSEPAYADGAATLYQGDARAVLRELPAESVQCVVTSPPYWGLRDYGLPPSVWGGDDDHQHGFDDLEGWCNQVLCPAWRGTLGLEPTPELYVQHLAEIMREVRRVLRPDGTLWLNMGDSYNGSGGAGGDYNAGGLKDGQPRYPGRNASGLKPKDLCGMPWRIAFALQADGWWLRSDIIWSKPNPMPESATDRPTSAHEYLFLLAKRGRYYYDQEAIRETAEYGGEQLGIVRGQKRRAYAMGREPSGNERPGVDAMAPSKRNRRSVWEIATAPYPDAHFATFPPDLVRPCILAGTKAGDTALDPFAGSGTTLAVAKELGRASIGIELSEDYVKLARKRIERVTAGMVLA